MDEFDKLLSIVQNADTFTKRVQELKDEQKKLVAMIETYAKVAEVDVKHAAAKADREEAAAALDAATKRASAIVSEATEKAAEIGKEAATALSKANAAISANDILKLKLESSIADAERDRKKAAEELTFAANLKKEVTEELAVVREKSAKIRAALA